MGGSWGKAMSPDPGGGPAGPSNKAALGVLILAVILGGLAILFWTQGGPIPDADVPVMSPSPVPLAPQP